MRQVQLLIALVFVTIFTSCNTDKFPAQLNESYKEAKAFTQGNSLFVSTGNVQREWELTDYGFITKQVKKDDKEFKVSKDKYVVDWNLSGILPENAKGNLVSLTADSSNDNGFTSEHLEVNAEFEYPTAGLQLKYVIWAFPNSPGIRTQIFIKKTESNKGLVPLKNPSRAEYIPIETEQAEVRYIGYYNDTQHRNTREDEILKEEIAKGTSSADWASIVDLQSDDTGIMLIQESHKCVNQTGVNSGGYYVDEYGISASGLGIGIDNITNDYRPLWAYWLVAYEGGNSERQLALKEFDRNRYPIDPKRDIYIMANNWGSGSSGDQSKYASREANILTEIQSQKDLGIDLQQVDDGWQGHQYNTWDYIATTNSKEFGTYDVYPEGWKNIKKSAAEEGLRLGLWAAWTIPGEKLLEQYNTGGFTSYKLDFARLKDYETFWGFINKIRTFVLDTDHNVRVNWDVTENPPRIGYFFGRDYGNIYLENRKPMTPPNVLYHPYLVLRDAWQVAKYPNLNKFQISAQNIDRTNKELSDAYLHNHPYSVAITLMGSPIFFQETRYYSEEARNQIRPLLKAYKEHRDRMFKGYVFPIGDKPDNASWTGFQNYNPKTKEGYLTIFREINNEESEKGFKLHFVKESTLKLTNLLTGEEEVKQVDADGNIFFEINDPADFRFYQYQIQ